MREDWICLYKYILRLVGIMESAKKEIIEKTHNDPESVGLAIKLANRKFILRIVKLVEKNIFNISNMIFLVNMIIFGNSNNQTDTMVFKYFKSISGKLFIGDSCIVNRDYGKEEPTKQKSRMAFLDARLILETVSSFKVYDFDIVKADKNQICKLIEAYLDIEYCK